MTAPSRLRIIVCGLLAQYPLGGVAWDYLQYLVGLRQLGHDVYYVEDTGQWPYDSREGGLGTGCDFNVAYLAALMDRFGLGDRWAYRFAGGAPRWFGLEESRRNSIVESADLLLDVSGCLAEPGRYRASARLAFIDSDPVFTQLKILRGDREFLAAVDEHDVHFSFGERVGETAFATGHEWLATRQPVLTSEWRGASPRRSAYTTVMNWTSFEPIDFEGQSFGHKDVELRRFLDLPGRVAVPLELAVAEGKVARPPRSLLRRHGWRVVDPARVCPDLDSYRAYIQGSRAEWSVAKNGYVRGQPGWFSCRSACYLAAGRPVIVEDTGLAGVLPVGEGLLAFTTLDEATAAIEECEANYPAHSRAALEIAREFFDSRVVLPQLVEAALGT